MTVLERVMIEIIRNTLNYTFRRTIFIKNIIIGMLIYFTMVMFTMFTGVPIVSSFMYPLLFIVCNTAMLGVILLLIYKFKALDWIYDRIILNQRDIRRQISIEYLRVMLTLEDNIHEYQKRRKSE